MRCLCGHTDIAHVDRGRCIGGIRAWLAKAPDAILRPGDRQMDPDEVKTIRAEAEARVARAPNYEKEWLKILRRGFIVMDCVCPIYHTIPIPSEETGVVLWGPDGKAAR